MVLLDALVRAERPTREEAIDAVLAVIEDAHSAHPVLFGSKAAAEFARLHAARTPAGGSGGERRGGDGAGYRDRTRDLRFTKPLLYQLS